MSLAEDFFNERNQHLFAWQDGPVIGSLSPDGWLNVIERDHAGGHRVLFRRELDADAILFLGNRQVMARLYLQDDSRLTIAETALDGKETHRWADLPSPETGAWTFHDVLEGTDRNGQDSLVLIVEDEEGNRRILEVSPSGEMGTHMLENAPPGELIYWNAAIDAAVLKEDRGPWSPLLRLCVPSSGEVTGSVVGRWLDGQDGTGVVLADATDTGAEPSLSLWNLTDGALTALHSSHGPYGWIEDARFIRGGTRRPSQLLAVRTVEADDRLDIIDPADGSVRPLGPDAPRSGRLRIRIANHTGIGLYGLSTLDSSSWHWISPQAAVATSVGQITAHPGKAACRHAWLEHTPALIYAPDRSPAAMVVSLHGGPESVERDELRWDGLYRELLDAGILVVGLNYAGSVSYGSDYQRQPWSDWQGAFQRDFNACLSEARARGIRPGSIALLGGSFGGSLALLGCVLNDQLAGAVACAPLVDLRRHMNRAVAADTHYGRWFAERFTMAPDSTSPHPVFNPGRLSDTGHQPVYLIHGDQDEVINWEDTAHAAALAKAHGRPWTFIQERGMGHVPLSPEQSAERYQHVRNALHSVLGIA
ncbi:alpha/beta hydrolase family protein [Streptomyces sp. NPDC006259]|uniref:alpha/beta hydrolase family protein n=1 Tax=Streptomyces sp. NPDC006259 TaxID=3364740 RepID=UPI0036C837EF